jgi:uncharacterized protein YndB with AHSA1/START domain
MPALDIAASSRWTAGAARRGLASGAHADKRAIAQSVIPPTVGAMFELTEEAEVSASVEKVWRDWTDAEAVVEWIWPPRFETRATIEPHREGRWEIRSDIAELAVLATVLQVDEPERLRLAWRWDGEEQVTDVEVRFGARGDAATRITVHHAGFETEAERDSHVEGWSNCLQRLVERYLQE